MFLCARDLGAESMQCLQIVLLSTHFVMSAWWGPPTYLHNVPVAAMFQVSEYEQTVTTIARMRKIDLNFRDPEPEAEELIADGFHSHEVRYRSYPRDKDPHLKI